MKKKIILIILILSLLTLWVLSNPLVGVIPAEFAFLGIPLVGLIGWLLIIE